MSRQIKHKLNFLLQKWPKEAVITSQWLSENGYYRQLIKKYKDSGWLKEIGHGAYVRLNEDLTWPGALYALQKQLEFPVHLGGLSALEFYGIAQYIRFDKNNNQFVLFNTTDIVRALPTWFTKNFPGCQYIQKHLFDKDIGLELKDKAGMSIVISSAERAILEVLSQVPNKFSYTHAYELVENLQLLRPDKLQDLLEQCLSIKVKRLFLYFADAHQLPCFNKLDIDKIDLGKGKRVIGDGGNYITRYKISVPKIAGDEEEEAYV